MTDRTNFWKGFAWMAFGTVLGTVMVILIRFAGDELHGFEIAFFRNVIAAAILLPWFLVRHRGRLPAMGLRWHLLRAACMATAMLSLFTAIGLLPVAEFTALSLMQPFAATAGAALFLHEKVPARRWRGMTVGLMGGLLVAMPDVGMALDAERMLGIGLIVVGTLAAVGDSLILRVVAQRQPTSTVVLWITLLVVPFTAVPAGVVWQPPSGEALLWLAGLALAATLGQFAATRALYWTEVSALTPFDFLRLVLAAAVGWALFDEVPSVTTLDGSALILGASVYVARTRAQD